MMKSLKYCDLQTESARQPLYQYRAATIHHRLASMYHSCFRNQVGENSRVCPARRDHKFIRNSIFEMISRKNEICLNSVKLPKKRFMCSFDVVFDVAGDQLKLPTGF